VTILEDEAFHDLVLSVSGASPTSTTTGPNRQAAPPKASAQVCAAYRREEKSEFTFKTFYEVLIAVLSLVTLILLVFAGWQVFLQNTAVMNVVLSGSGAIVTGVGAGFLGTQRKQARAAWRAAQKAFRTYC